MKNLSIPKWIFVWLIISTIIITWETSFILLRPASFADKAFSVIWHPYTTYMKIDTSYADLHNHFLIALAYMNILDIGLSMVAIYLFFSRRDIAGMIIAFSALLITSVKTIFVFVHEAVGGVPTCGT